MLAKSEDHGSSNLYQRVQYFTEPVAHLTKATCTLCSYLWALTWYYGRQSNHDGTSIFCSSE